MALRMWVAILVVEGHLRSRPGGIMRRRSVFAPIIICAALALFGCGTSSDRPPSGDATSQGSTSESPDVAAEGLHLVVIGDSIPFTSFCPGCEGFVAQYATTLQERSGELVAVANRSRDDSAGIPEIREQVTNDAELRAELAGADVVVISVGFNNAVPDYEFPPPQGRSPRCDVLAPGIADQISAFIVAITPSCTEEITNAWGEEYDAIFSELDKLRAGKPTSFIVLNVYDANTDPAELRRAANSKKEFVAGLSHIVLAYDQLNDVLCKTAVAHNYSCVDLYHAMNGPDGTTPLGAWTIDGAHPSQKGNDLIAGLLADVDVSAVTN
jgi:lysophospholipase L1-like esterase